MAANWLEFFGSIGMVISTTIALIVSFIYLAVIALSQGQNLSVSFLLARNTFLAALTYGSAHFSIVLFTIKENNDKKSLESTKKFISLSKVIYFNFEQLTSIVLFVKFFVTVINLHNQDSSLRLGRYVSVSKRNCSTYSM